jgi:hypothetical protein
MTTPISEDEDEDEGWASSVAATTDRPVNTEGLACRRSLIVTGRATMPSPPVGDSATAS